MTTTGGFTTTPNYVIDYILSKMHGKEAKIMLAYARFANTKGETWPSIKTVSEISGISERSVQRWRDIIVHERHLLHKVGLGRMDGTTAPGGTKRGRGWFVKYKMSSQMYIEYHRVGVKPANEVAPLPGEGGHRSGTIKNSEGSHKSGMDNVDNSVENPEKACQNTEKSMPEQTRKDATPMAEEGLCKVTEGKGLLRSCGKQIGNGNGALKGTAKTAGELQAALHAHLKTHPELATA